MDMPTFDRVLFLTQVEHAGLCRLTEKRDLNSRRVGNNGNEA